MTQIKKVKLRPDERVRKHDWLAAALDLLRIGGIEAVRIERLASELGVAKSGCYYHFGDRAGLHDALLDYWLGLDRAPSEAVRKIADEPPAEKLALVSDMVDRANLGRYDFAIRQWARQDLKVRRIWRREMNRRLEVIRNIFAEAGFTGDDQEMRTRMFVAYQVSEREIFNELTSKQRIQLRNKRLTLLLTP